jgi:hypothetical protein
MINYSCHICTNIIFKINLYNSWRPNVLIINVGETSAIRLIVTTHLVFTANQIVYGYTVHPISSVSPLIFTREINIFKRGFFLQYLVWKF